MRIYTVTLSDIVWDTESDGEEQEVDLPKSLTMEVEEDEGATLDVLHDAALDRASDDVGFCILSSTISSEVV